MKERGANTSVPIRSGKGKPGEGQRLEALALRKSINAIEGLKQYVCNDVGKAFD